MRKNNSSKIDISVVVPAYNEEKLLPLCLEALNNQDFKGAYEIIVVNNGSQDKTREIAKKFKARLIKESKRGVAFARQAGFSAAKGEIIASTDADTIVPKNWLSRIYEALQKNPQAAAITGGIDLFGETDRKLVIFNIVSPFLRLLTWIFSGKSHVWGANFAIRRDIWQKIGGFDTRLAAGEDCDLGNHAKEFGKIIFLRNLRVITSARRFEESAGSGHIKHLFNLYFLNFWWMLIFKKPKINQLGNVRTWGKARFLSPSWLKVARIIALSGVCFVLVFLFVALGITSPRSQVFGKTYWHKHTHDKIIALTFDDGPNEPYTSQVLDILAKNDIHATFFTLGENVRYYPEIVKRAYSEGNVIANHSYSHEADLSIEENKTVDKEIGWTQNAIYAIIGKKPHLFRPPHGFKSPMLLSELKKNDLITIQWSDMTNDYYRPGEKKIAKRIINKARPGGIIVLHDGDKTRHGSDRSQSVEALKQIISALQQKGYHFVTVPELLGVPAYNN